MKTNQIGSICVYTCTIYTYMHHEIPPKCKIYLVGLPSVLYETPGHNERSVLNQLFLSLFRCFSCTFNEKSHFSWKQTKPGQYVCIHAPFTHTCTTKYHQNVRYTQLAFPLYSMKHQVIMRDLCWISCFCCFSVKSTVSWKVQCFSWKAQCFSVKSATPWEAQCFSVKCYIFNLPKAVPKYIHSCTHWTIAHLICTDRWV